MIKPALLFCCIAIFVVSCKKPADQSCFGLVSPVGNPQHVSPVFINFSWLNCTNMPADMVVSAQRDYSKPAISKEIIGTTFQADTILYPNTTYYWIVTVKGQDQSFEDSFTTSAVSGIVSGKYEGTASRSNYAFIGDTIYSYTLTVTDAGNDNILLQIPGADTVVFSKITTTDTTIIYSCKPCTGKYSAFKRFEFVPARSALRVEFQTTSSDFDEWDFTGAKPVY